MVNSVAAMASVCLGLLSVMMMKTVMMAVMKCSVSPVPAARPLFSATTQCVCHAYGLVMEILIVQMAQTNGLRTAVTDLLHLPASRALIWSFTVAQGNVFRMPGDVMETLTVQIDQMRMTVVSEKTFFILLNNSWESLLSNFSVVEVLKNSNLNVFLSEQSYPHASQMSSAVVMDHVSMGAGSVTRCMTVRIWVMKWVVSMVSLFS